MIMVEKTHVSNGADTDSETTAEVSELELAVDELLNLPIAYQERRHVEEISSMKALTQTWRMKERMKTVSVALVLCLNVGVDPPDVIKTTPCARKECWLDPLTQGPQKALETIGGNLQKQYERWQPRARYKQSLDPTVDDVKRLCSSLRRNAKEERVLFHYNGHGVPRPTTNGEIWVFNQTYTQYIPLSIYDLQTWMGSPSIFVYDCSCAGLIVQSFQSFALQREQDMQQVNGMHTASIPDIKNCIQLGACLANQLLPMNPELPADLFTACLTTPIKIALQWFCHQRHGSIAPGVTLDLIEKIPGRLNDRRTPLGELNWIFTAITDTIAWNTLPRELFQKLFRQDLLVASLFRNFLLAERIMRSYKCTPVSEPQLPPTFRHPMWAAWDHAVDVCLSQLPHLLSDDPAAPTTHVFRNSPFFAQQLTAFQVWLSLGVEHREAPEQLPIVLQVLLSQVHRVRALDLLASFLDLGPWAVSLALSVGIFPYVLKLLQSLAKELRPMLVFIWAKILAVDSTCQSDLVKDGGHQYFLRALQDAHMSAAHRTMAAFVLAEIVHGNPAGQEACLQRNVISICLDQLDDHALSSPKLRQWVSICLGRIWTSYDDARWRGVRDRAHERLYELLDDPEPEVRTAAVFALGAFVANQPDTASDHAAHVNQAVGATLVTLQRRDASALVRTELTSALHRLVACYDSSFAAIAFRFVEEERNFLDGQQQQQQPGGRKSHHRMTSQSSRDRNRSSLTEGKTSSSNYASQQQQHSGADQRRGSGDVINRTTSSEGVTSSSSRSREVSESEGLTRERLQRLRKISLSALPSTITGSSYSSVNANIWKVLLSLAVDPHPAVANLAKSVVTGVMEKVVMMAREQSVRYSSTTSTDSFQSSSSQPSSPKRNPAPTLLQPPRNSSEGEPLSHQQEVVTSSTKQPIPIQLTPYHRTRKVFGKGPEKRREIFRADEITSTQIPLGQERACATEFCEWSASAFAQPTDKEKQKAEGCSDEVMERRRKKARDFASWRIHVDATHQKIDMSRLAEQQFFNKNPQPPVALRFHPDNHHLLAADRTGAISVWEWESGQRRSEMRNNDPAQATITCMQFINQHHHRTLLAVGSDDGCVRVWNDCCSSRPELVAAWQAISDGIPSSRSSGLVMSWDQSRLHLYTAGDSRHVQLWNLASERKQQEFLTGADSCVTCLSFSKRLLAAGCGDGTMRLFDFRSSFRQTTLQAHDTWVVSADFVSHDLLLTASELGAMKLWDVRKISNEPYRTIKSNLNGGLRRVDVHPTLSIVACASTDHSISMINLNGNELSVVEYYDGFLGRRIGLVTCMSYHPLLANLAVGTADSFLSVYSGENKSQA